ncbi:glycosyltransferase family 2 protein [Comamonas sp. wu1-DMT]|uniref:glycosyltransferase family 2 protein n=1 Tax=Comamonas sp. wu1-DMT TaxID=3126390 RepID=UPI0032E52989
MQSPQEYESLIYQLNLQINQQRSTLQRIYNSPSWRLTHPLRKLGGIFHKHLFRRTKLDLVPVHHLEKGEIEHRWMALGNDPQFFLQPHNPAVMRQRGWALLEFTLSCNAPTIIQVFIDVGDGFQDDLVLTLPFDGSGFCSIPLYLPGTLRSLRLDPLNRPGDFSLTKVQLKRVEHPGVFPPEHEGVLSYLASLDEINCQLVPLHQISRNLQSKYHWESHGEDPHFLLSFNGHSRLEPGWYRIDLLQHGKKKRGSAKLYFDTGAGFNEAETAAIPLVSGILQQRLFHCEKPALSVRFDPKETQGHFRIERLQLVHLTAEQARELMLQRLMVHNKQTRQQLLQTLENAAAMSGQDVQALLESGYGDSFATRQGSIAYQEWIEDVEAIGLPSVEQVQAQLETMAHKPLISIVMPVYNTDEIYLKACIDSVLSQSYPYWELCIADDASPKPHIKQVLQAYERQDSRIKVVYREKNGHISLASNSALDIAQGEFVALLDHDDALPMHALFFMAEAINEKPAAQILYSDEDKLDKNGQRFEPHFKSDWNPDLFYSQNYVSHLGVYKRDLLQRIKGFRTGVEGSQDQDLLLRCLPHVKGENIIHIPRVLYHWRTVEGSTALASGEKSYTTEAGIKALRDHFAQNGPKGIEVEAGIVPNTYRVRWPIPKKQPLVSLLIPTRDRRSLTEVAVRSILEKTTYSNYEILILDNGSIEPETLEFFELIQKEDGRVRVLRYDYPFNYSAINNFGEQHAKGSIIGLVNNDVEVISPEWLAEMVSHAIRPEIGCVGAKLYFSNNTLQHGGVIMGLGGVAGHSHKHFPRNHPGYFHRLVLTQNLSGVTAACLLIRRDIYRKVNGLDESNLKVAFNDVDFCLKVRAEGYRNLWTPYAELYHYESISRGQEDNPEKIARFNGEVNFMKEKWGDFLKCDPFYSQNLTKDREDFSL